MPGRDASSFRDGAAKRGGYGAGHLDGGGADVDDDGLARLQQSRGDAGQSSLGLLVDDGAFGERGFLAAHPLQQAGGAAVHAPDRAALLEQREVASHGLGRYAKAVDQFVGADRVRTVHQVDDGVVPSYRKHTAPFCGFVTVSDCKCVMLTALRQPVGVKPA